jgi:hypothetical protein
LIDRIPQETFEKNEETTFLNSLTELGQEVLALQKKFQWEFGKLPGSANTKEILHKGDVDCMLFW